MVYDNYAIQYPTLQEAYEAGNFENVSILAGTDLGEFTQDRFADLNTAEAFYAYYKDMLPRCGCYCRGYRSYFESQRIYGNE